MSSAKTKETISRLQKRTSERKFTAMCGRCRWTHKAKTQAEANAMERGHAQILHWREA